MDFQCLDGCNPIWPLWTTYTVLGLVALFVARRWPWTASLWFLVLPISSAFLFNSLFNGFPYTDFTPVLIAVVLALAGAYWGLRRRRSSQSGLTSA